MGARHVNAEKSPNIGVNGARMEVEVVSSVLTEYLQTPEQIIPSVWCEDNQVQDFRIRQNSCVESIPHSYHKQVPGLQLQQGPGGNLIQ
jgi:hypothetical protein